MKNVYIKFYASIHWKTKTIVKWPYLFLIKPTISMKVSIANYLKDQSKKSILGNRKNIGTLGVRSHIVWCSTLNSRLPHRGDKSSQEYIFANYKTNQVQHNLCLPTLVPPLMNFAHNETKPTPAVPKFILLGLSLIN